ncbi:MAG: ATP-dependent DNA helicase [Lachnospiraceae bacterium]|jgi:DNA excision repair protein ERCC-2
MFNLKLYRDDAEYRVDISVRKLVEFVLREGSLRAATGETTDLNAMLKGARIHRKIQSQKGLDYQSEVVLKQVLSFDGYRIFLEGRADGISRTDGKLCVEEIKGVFSDPEEIRKEKYVHLAQAMCYGYMVCELESEEGCSVKIIYADVETAKTSEFEYYYSFAELKAFFDGLMDDLRKWIEFKIEWIERRNSSISAITFPYEYRAGQKNLIKSVYLTIKNNKKIFVEAATGIGKTLAVLYPTLKAMGEGEAGRFYYLTSKTVTGKAADDALALLSDKGLELKRTFISAREKMCFKAEVRCDDQYCEYARDFYSGINDILLEILKSENDFDRDVIRKYAEKYRICPYYLSLELASWCDGIVCDYNYVFSPDVRLSGMFEQPEISRDVILVDEAHNLVDRARDMYSAVLNKDEVLKARRIVKEKSPKIYKRLSLINKKMIEHRKNTENGFRVIERDCKDITEIVSVIELLMFDFAEYFEKNGDPDSDSELLEFYFSARKFFNQYNPDDRNYVCYEEETKEGFLMKLFCINPSDALRECLKAMKGTVFFSATLLPVDYYKSLLGFSEGDYEIYAGSPFDPARKQIIISNDVSSKYTMRNENMYRTICRYILKTAEGRKGNYMVFFPSYKYLQDVFEVFRREFDRDDLTWVVQSRIMSEEDREIFLENFYENNSRTMIGFCVMGSLFSEGIDLIGDKLIGAVIVGTGIPQVSNETGLLRDAYEEQGFDGFDYAFRFPGMNKVLQAAGRVIRTEHDRGVIVLLDNRFLEHRYQKLFPREWKGFSVTEFSGFEEIIASFWKNQEL